MHRHRLLSCAVMLLVIGTPMAAAQTAPLDRLVDRFVLDTVTVTAGDLSADGKWLAATAGSLRGRIGIDNTRFQDPTYVAPALVDLLIIDTSTGASQKVFPEPRQVRGFKWSPDGSQWRSSR